MYSNAAALNDSDPEEVPLYRPAKPIFDTRHSGQGSHPPNISINWETISPRIPRVIRPSPQKVLGRASISGAASTAYAPYSHPRSNQVPPLTAREFVYQVMGRPPLSYPFYQTANAGTHNTPLDVPEGPNRQSLSQTLSADRPPSGLPNLPSASLNHAILTKSSGQSHAPLVPDHNDRDFLGVLSDPLDGFPRGSTQSSSASRETCLGLWTADIDPTVLHEADATAIPSPPPLVPIGWRRIPQRPYIPRMRDRSFLLLEGFTFSVNRVAGFNMQLALDQNFVGLDDRDEPVLENANGPVSCRLLFPGYPTNTWCNQIAARNWRKKRAPIMKSKLAYEVAKRVNKYLEALTTIPIDPSADPRWAAGRGWMKLEKMYLVSVSWVSKGSLQPEIWVDTGDP